MTKIRITRTIQIPDPIKISRYQKSPELGPNILFFSGGSALNKVSRKIKSYSFNTTHLITPFDSGGSSAKLRDAFGMPSIGDLRSRLIALADESITGHPDVYRLFTYRLPIDEDSAELLRQLDSMIHGKNPLIQAILNPMRQLIRNQLGFFRVQMPNDFDLRGASVGNLILAGGYLNNHRHLDPIIFLFAKLVNVRGTVRAVINKNLHLVAELQNGDTIIGQHALTGKEVKCIESPVKNLFLSESRISPQPITPELKKKTCKLIQESELICYSPGSFYSSLIANLLPYGVGNAIAKTEVPKVFFPNLGQDPEQIGMTMQDSIETLIKHLKMDNENTPINQLLNFIIIDSENGQYNSPIPYEYLKSVDVQIIDTALISLKSTPYYDAKMMVQTLLSLT